MLLGNLDLKCGEDHEGSVSTDIFVDEDSLKISNIPYTINEEGVYQLLALLEDHGIEPVEAFEDWQESCMELSFHVAPLLSGVDATQGQLLEKAISTTVKCWEDDFGNNKLDPASSDWVDETYIEGIEETPLIRERFNIEVLLKIGTDDALSAYYWEFLKERVTIQEVWIADHYPSDGNIPLTVHFMSDGSAIVLNPLIGDEFYPTVRGFNEAYAEFDYDWNQVDA